MRKIGTIALVFATTLAVATASARGAGQVATPSSPSVVVGAYELRNADRGPVKRVKVFHNGRLVATIVLRRGESAGYCCTQDSCKRTDAAPACATLTLSCGEDGLCSAA